MDTDASLSDKIVLLFLRYESFVRNHPLRAKLPTSYHTGKSPLRDGQYLKVPSNHVAFLRDFLHRYDEVLQLFELMGQPDGYKKRFKSLTDVITGLTELSSEGQSISELAPREIFDGPDLAVARRSSSAKNDSKVAYLDVGSDFDEGECAVNHKASRRSTQQPSYKARLPSDNFVDLTTETVAERKEPEILTIPDSSQSDESSSDVNPRKKLKVNRRVATSPSSNNTMSIVEALSESSDLLFARCKKFSRTLPEDHSLRTMIEEQLPVLSCSIAELQVPTDPTDFLNDINSRYDEVYRLYDRMGRPSALLGRLHPLKCLMSILSDSIGKPSISALSMHDGPPSSKGNTPRRTARLKDDSNYDHEARVKNFGSEKFAKGSNSSNGKLCDLTANEPVEENSCGTTASLVASEDVRSVYASEHDTSTENTETDTDEGVNRVHDSSMPLALQRPPQCAPPPSATVLVAQSTPVQSRSNLFFQPKSDYESSDFLESDVPEILQNLSPSRPRHVPLLSIRASGHAQESHEKPIYCVSWSKDFSRSKKEAKEQSVSRYLSTCGSKFVTVYRVVFDSSHPRRVKSRHFIMTQSHITDDEQESFYACTFAGRTGGHETAQSRSSSKNMPELLCIGGARRVIHVIDICAKKTVMTLRGHGESVLSLKPCPTDEWILLSTSEDESIRLWNLRSGSPVAILKGREGHLDSVVSAAWNLDASLLVSGGMDTTIKIWDAREGSQLKDSIARSHQIVDLFENEGVIIHEKPLLVKSPIFSTQRVHIHCVDCVQFIQNGLVLSKSVDSRIELWEPILEGPDSVSLRMKHQSKIQHLHTFEYRKGGVWYMSFATDLMFKRLAVGDCDGYVHIWNIGQKSSASAHVLSTQGKMQVLVRGVTFSPCGNTLLACRDDGTIAKWDL